MKPSEFKTVGIALLVTIAIVALTIGIMHGVKYVRPAFEASRFMNATQVAEKEKEDVTAEMINKYPFTLVYRDELKGTPYHYWKLQYKNHILRFHHMPEHIHWTWNVGEVVDKFVITDLLILDEEIHETYNLHKSRQYGIRQDLSDSLYLYQKQIDSISSAHKLK